jgi:hypothetical protein
MHEYQKIKNRALIIISANAWKVGWVEERNPTNTNVGFHFVQPNLHGGPNVVPFIVDMKNWKEYRLIV